MNRRPLLAGPLALIVAAACAKSAPPPAPPPPQVSVVTVAPEPVPESYDFTAEVQPYRRVEVRARVDGVIEARPFTEGALVKPGQVLYRLDGIRQRAAYQGALAAYENAKISLARLEPLLADSAAAKQDVDNARAQVRSARASLDQATKDLEDVVVRAQIAGRIGRTQLDVGARVTGPSDLLTTIDVLDPIYVTFQPSAQQLLQWDRNPSSRRLIEPGSPLEIQVVLPDGSLFAKSGKLDFVAPSLDASTGTREFRARFPNADRLLLPGQFVRARLTGFTRDSAFAIPQRAVQQALGRQFVYLVGAGDTAASRDVLPGPWSGDRWIIDSGLVAGDRVIVDGVQKVAAGLPVRAVPLADTAATAMADSAAGASSAGSR